MVFSDSSDGVSFEVGFEADAGSVATDRRGAWAGLLMSLLNFSSSSFASRIILVGRFLNSFDVFWNTFQPSDVTISRIHLPMVLPAFCISFGPDTLARNLILDSSTGSAIDFSAGADVTVRIVWPASIGTESDLHMRSMTPGGRLTLASGIPDYQPLNSVAVSGQDTGADTITVTGHGWTVGTMVKSSATSGGLTVDVQYYVGNVTANTVSLHTTLAAALAGTSKVDITGAVTADITANGVANTSIYYAPNNHNLISLWNGYRWQTMEFSEIELIIGTVTANKPFDIFAFINAGAVTLEKLEWTSDTVRATELSRQDGRYCKSGDKTRLWLGSFYSTGTDSTERSQSSLYLVNYYNRTDFSMDVRETASTWTYNLTAWRQVNANSANKINFILPTKFWPIITFNHYRAFNASTTPRAVAQGVALDNTTVRFATPDTIFCTDTLEAVSTFSAVLGGIPVGKHYLAAIEGAAGLETQTFRGGKFHQYIRAIIPA